MIDGTRSILELITEAENLVPALRSRSQISHERMEAKAQGDE
jgi:hypothetical protein